MTQQIAVLCVCADKEILASQHTNKANTMLNTVESKPLIELLIISKCILNNN